MQHGSSNKRHLLDPGWNYGETKWVLRAFGRRGHTCPSRYQRFLKREFARAERRHGKKEILLCLTEED